MKQAIIALFTIGVALLLTVVVYLQIPKIAYVDATSLFQEFEGKKEMEQQLEQMQRGQKQVLDSIGLQLKALEQMAQKEEAVRVKWMNLQQYHSTMNQEYQAQQYQKSQEYTQAIWKQINQYTQEYGQEQGYDYILSTAGQQGLLYAKEGQDITQEVVNYINQKYTGN